MTAQIYTGVKRKHAELTLLRMEQDIKSRIIDHQFKEKSLITSVVADYTLICTNTIIDERAQIKFKDAYLNMLNASPEPVSATLASKPSINTETKEDDQPMSAEKLSSTLATYDIEMGYFATIMVNNKSTSTELREEILQFQREMNNMNS